MTDKNTPIIKNVILSPDIFDLNGLDFEELLQRVIATKVMLNNYKNNNIIFLKNNNLFEKYLRNFRKFSNSAKGKHQDKLKKIEELIKYIETAKKDSNLEDSYCRLCNIINDKSTLLGVAPKTYNKDSNCANCEFNKECIDVDAEYDELQDSLTAPTSLHYYPSSSFDDIKREFLKPFVDISSKIIICDKQIGKAIDFEYEELSENFEYNLDFLISQIYKIKNCINLQIWTSYDNKRNLDLTKLVLKKYVDRIKKEIGIRISFLLFYKHDLEHDRFIMNKEHYCYNIGRGVDIVNLRTNQLWEINISRWSSEKAKNLSDIPCTKNYILIQ